MTRQRFKVYTGQGLLRLDFDTGNPEIVGGIAVVKYISPTLIEGEFPALVDPPYVRLQMTNTMIDEAGTWVFQPVVTVNGLIGPCDPVQVTFSTPIF